MRFGATALATLTTLCVVAGCGGQQRSAASASTTGTGPSTTTCADRSPGPTTYRYATRDGADPDLTSLDVYLPPGCGPAPVVVWVHGGGWRIGDKTKGEVVRKAALVNGLGAALVSVNYRLSSPGNDVRWPDHGDDVAAAVEWVVRDGADHGLDPDRLSLVGHSAGGQLVAGTVANPALLERAGGAPASVDCVVVLDTNLDFTTGRAAADPVVDGAFGRDPEVLADASPTEQVRRHGAPAAKFLVVTRGGSDRRAAAAKFVDTVTGAGGTATLSAAPGYTHSEVSTMLGAPDEELVTAPTAAFLRRCLGPSTGPRSTTTG